MPKTVNAGGKSYSFPDDASVSDISDALGAMEQGQKGISGPKPSPAAAPPDTPWYQRPIVPPTAMRGILGTSQAHDIAEAPPSMSDADHPTVYGLKTGLAKSYDDVTNLASAATNAQNLATFAGGAISKAAKTFPAVAKIPGIMKVAKGAGVVAGGGIAASSGLDMPENSDFATFSSDREGGNTGLGINLDPDKMQRYLMDAAGVAGGTAGAGASGKGIAPKTAADLMNKKMGVTPEQMRYTNPGAEVVKQGPFAWTKRGLQDKVSKAADEVGSKVDPIYADADTAGTKVNMRPAFDPSLEALSKSISEGEPGVHNKIQDFRGNKMNEPLIDPNTGRAVEGGNPSQPKNIDRMRPTDAVTMKRGIARTKWTGQPEEQTMDQVRRETHGAAKDALNKAVPEAAPFNERYAGLTEAEDALDKQSRTAGGIRVPASDYITGAGILGATGITDHNPMHLAANVATGLAAKHVLGSTPVVTGLAHFLGEQEPLETPPSRIRPITAPGQVLPPIGGTTKNPTPMGPSGPPDMSLDEAIAAHQHGMRQPAPLALPPSPTSHSGEVHMMPSRSLVSMDPGEIRASISHTVREQGNRGLGPRQQQSVVRPEGGQTEVGHSGNKLVVPGNNPTPADIAALKAKHGIAGVSSEKVGGPSKLSDEISQSIWHFDHKLGHYVTVEENPLSPDQQAQAKAWGDEAERNAPERNKLMQMEKFNREEPPLPDLGQNDYERLVRSADKKVRTHGVDALTPDEHSALLKAGIINAKGEVLDDNISVQFDKNQKGTPTEPFRADKGIKNAKKPN